MEAEWHIFYRQQGDDLSTVAVCDVEPRDRGSRCFAVVLNLEYKARADGLPEAGELDRVTDLEEKVEAVLQSVGGLHVGHVTGGGRMRSVFYLPTREVPPLTVKQGLFKKVTLVPDVREDADWSLYETLLAPTPIERQITHSRPLIETLKRHGDLHERVRPVDFTVFFPSSAARDLFVPNALEAGWRVGDEGTWDTDHDEFAVQLTKDSSVVPEVIAQECVRMHELAAAHGGEFDGWACPVVTA